MESSGVRTLGVTWGRLSCASVRLQGDMMKVLGTLLRLFLNWTIINRFFEKWGAGKPLVREGVTPLDQMLDDAAAAGKPLRVMWVAAHPDDESFLGSVLAKASLKCKGPLHLVVLTHGEGGETGKLPEVEEKGLAEVRRSELDEVVKLYNATLSIRRYFNASLPTDSFPYRHDLAAMWAKDGDPATYIANEIRAFRPDVVLTFSPKYGATGHPEHQLASRFTTQAIRMAADANSELEGEPHTVQHTYYMLAKYWLLRIGQMKPDPLPYTETFDLRQPCVDGRRCVDVMADNTRPHRTQNNDMALMRTVNQVFYKQYLHKCDPFTEMEDPYEEWNVRGMG